MSNEAVSFPERRPWPWLCAAASLLLWAGCAATSRIPVAAAGGGTPGLSPTASTASPVTTVADPQATLAAPPVAASQQAVVPAGFVSTVPGSGVQLTAATEPAAAPLEPLTASAMMEEISLAEALRYAVEQHPRLRARKYEIEVARGKLVAAGTLANPQLVLDYDTSVEEDDGSEVSGRLMFTIPTADKLRLGKSVASAEICQAQYAYSREKRLILQEVGDAGVDVLYYQELLGLQGRLSELAAKQVALQQGRFQAGEAPAADAIQAEIAAKDVELRRLDTQTQLDTARVRLWRAMGMGSPGLRGLKGALTVEPLPAVPPAKLLAAAEHNAPEIHEARAALARAQRQLALERARAIPDVEIGPRTQNVVGAEGRHPVLGGRFAVDLPLFDRNQGAIGESAAQIEVQRALMEDAALTTLGDVAALYAELHSLQTRLQYYQSQVLPLAERTEAALRENDVGRAMPPNQAADLLREVVRIRAVHLEIRYRYATLYRQLENLLGCRLAELQTAVLTTP
jgi:cobalt-zinc-cadmium efflux system outer membrane protein